MCAKMTQALLFGSLPVGFYPRQLLFVCPHLIQPFIIAGGVWTHELPIPQILSCGRDLALVIFLAHPYAEVLIGDLSDDGQRWTVSN